jgi:prepilin-type N-terminal cleavage/methylation domain-containing protein
MLKIALRNMKFGQKAFTLIEVLVVIAILGAVAGIAYPNVVKYMNHGQVEARGEELHNVQVAATVMLAESKQNDSANQIVPISGVSSFNRVETTDGLKLSDYLLRLKADTSSDTGCTYDFDAAGNVTQHVPS